MIAPLHRCRHCRHYWRIHTKSNRRCNLFGCRCQGFRP